MEAKYRYLLSQGDLCQMADQERFLRQKGFDVTQVDIFPALATEEDYVRALRAIYNSYVNGWWNYQDQYVKHGICTDEEFRAKFRKSMEVKAARSVGKTIEVIL